MSINSATGRIKIIKIPQGEAPEEIRREWVGIFLPCEPILGFSNSTQFGAVTGRKKQNSYSFHVPQIEAIEALEKKSPGAAKWWREHHYPQPNMNFVFDEDEAEIIYGVIRQQIIEVTDEMQGDPNR